MAWRLSVVQVRGRRRFDGPDTMAHMTVQTWLDGQVDRALSRQRAQAETAKLMATFASALSGALVGTAFQVHGRSPNTVDLVSLALMVLAGILTVGVLLSDRLREVDHERILTQGVSAALTQEEQLVALRTAALAALSLNDDVVKRMRALMLTQLLAALGATMLSAASLGWIG